MSASNGAHLIVILDEQNRLGATQGRRWRRSTRATIDHRIHARKVDLERRPFAGLAVDPHATAALLDDAEDRRESQAGTLASLLRREEGLEDAGQRRLVDADAGVGDGKHHVRPGRHPEMVTRIRLVENDVARLHRELAASGHGVASVHDEVHDDLLDVARIDSHPPEWPRG